MMFRPHEVSANLASLIISYLEKNDSEARELGHMLTAVSALANICARFEEEDGIDYFGPAILFLQALDASWRQQEDEAEAYLQQLYNMGEDDAQIH